MAWKVFGKSKNQKSTKQLYEEMERLEKQEKEAQERALIEARIAEIKHKKRNAIINTLKSVGSTASSSAYKMATSKKTKKFLKDFDRHIK